MSARRAGGASTCRWLLLCAVAWSCEKSSGTNDVPPSRTPLPEPERALTPTPQPLAVSRPPAPRAALDAKHSDFGAYWRELRPALLTADAESAARLTSFPLTVRGEMDDDPVREVDRAAFPDVFRQLLAQDVGLSPEPQALSEYVQRLTEPPTGSVSGRTARVASLEFALRPEGWRLVRAYLSESE